MQMSHGYLVHCWLRSARLHHTGLICYDQTKHVQQKRKWLSRVPFSGSSRLSGFTRIMWVKLAGKEGRSSQMFSCSTFLARNVLGAIFLWPQCPRIWEMRAQGSWWGRPKPRKLLRKAKLSMDWHFVFKYLCNNKPTETESRTLSVPMLFAQIPVPTGSLFICSSNTYSNNQTSPLAAGTWLSLFVSPLL